MPFPRFPVLGAALLAAPLAAQPAPFLPIVPGQTVSGEVRATDPGYAWRGPFVVYAFDARAGTRYVAELRSDDFDAYLVLARSVRGLTETLLEDDDGAGGTDARLRFRVEHSGPHLLVAQALNEGTGGRFTLSLRELPPPPPLVARPLALGDRVAAALADDGPVVELDWGGEALAHLYRLELRAGQRLQVRMDSEAFDPYLEFGPLVGSQLSVTDVDDDSGGQLNALLRVTVPADGTYGLRARAFAEGQAGPYVLQVAEWMPAVATVQPLPLGTTVEGYLHHDEDVTERGAHFQTWTFTARAGERYRITLRSEVFDTYLHVGRVHEGRFEEWAANDDAEGTDSIVELTVPVTGEVAVRASSFGQGIAGTYTLRAERLAN